MKNSSLFIKVMLVNALVLLMFTAAHSNTDTDKPEQLATINKASDSFSAKVKGKGVTLKVKGPDGYYSQQYVGDSGGSLDINDVSKLKDGVYHYEFTGRSSSKAAEISKNQYKDNFNNGRSSSLRSKRAKNTQAIMQSGFLVVKNGQIIVDDIEEGAAQ